MKKIYLFFILTCFINKFPEFTGFAQGSPVVASRVTLGGTGPFYYVKTSGTINSIPINDSTLISTAGANKLINDTARTIASWVNSSFLSTASPAASITNTDISNWNNTYSAVYTDGWGLNKSSAGSTTTFFADTTEVASQSALNTVAASIPTNNNQLANGANYITGISGSDVITALGYTPYNSSNPDGYINSVPAQSFASLTGKPTTLSGYGITDGISTARNAISLTTTGTSGTSTYNPSTGVLNVPQYTNSGGTVTSVSVTSTNLTVSGSPITSTGSIAVYMPTVATAGTYNASYTVDVTGRITTGTNVSFNTNPNRSLSTTGSNNTFTISTTKNARVTYVVNISVALTLLPPLTSNAVISLDYSLDGGANYITVCRATQTYGVAVTLTTSSDYVLSGEIPANALVRIYRSSTTGATVTLPTNAQQEVTY